MGLEQWTIKLVELGTAGAVILTVCLFIRALRDQREAYHKQLAEERQSFLSSITNTEKECRECRNEHLRFIANHVAHNTRAMKQLTDQLNEVSRQISERSKNVC
jgi:hypothetical protein